MDEVEGSKLTGMYWDYRSILVVICENPGIIQSKIAKAVGIDPANITRAIPKLIEAELIYRELDERSKGQPYHVYPTDRLKDIHEQQKKGIKKTPEKVRTSITSRISASMEKFQDTDSLQVKRITLGNLQTFILPMQNEYTTINWTEFPMKVFVDSYFDELFNYDDQMNSMFFSILETAYELGYFDNDNIQAMKTIITTHEFSHEDSHVLRGLYRVLGLSLSQDSENEVVFESFIDLLRVMNYDSYWTQLIRNNGDVISRFTPELRDWLNDRITRIIEPYKNPEKSIVLTEFIERMRSGWQP